ncbi:hypothetical protein K469DRAFT_684373 [Zopfia rhizophila CBS 207.26]|uniref:Nephrocystin 3-like N-terminal domain-containing protein n=1 Tax=Zopfia rhizophila CBS 207.26 TaxID=1314779 RepID=A0A6A6D821_9PEZI|nr:hypothetical protein K469DRAFT_684373 [Zopfia rhizophila CBS 207.26]
MQINAHGDVHLAEIPGVDQCLCDLGITNPKDNKARIKATKDDLLKDSYVWILNDEAFLRWRDDYNTQPGLITHVQTRYKTRGSQLFEGPNAIYALQEILENMLNDHSLARIYLLVDALNECNTELQQLLDTVTRKDRKSRSTIKWLVTSQHKPEINERLKPDALRLKVSLVCQELEKPLFPFETLNVLKELPSGLEPLYKRIIEQIQQPDLCIQVLRLAAVAYRPLHLQELITITRLPVELCKNSLWVTKLIELCSSFLTIREKRVYLVHQSVKDFLTNGKGSSIFPSSIYKEHYDIMDRSIQAMSAVLRENIYSLKEPGAQASGPGDEISNSPLMRIEYTCCYWANHLTNYVECPSRVQQHASILRDDRIIHTFLQDHLLHWLEAMGLLKKIFKTGQAMRLLQFVVLQWTTN